MSYRNRTIVIAVVLAVWVANFVATIFVTDYRPSESVNAVFAAVIGGAVAVGSRSKKGPDE